MVVQHESPKSGQGAAEEERIDRMFHALADTTRRDIVRRVMRCPHSVTELSGEYNMSFAAVQKHVAVLEHAALVMKKRRGREQLVCANIRAIRTATRHLEQLEQLWTGRIERIDAIVSE